MKAEMTGQERILTAIAHQEPDRVPISPRYSAWMTAEYGDWTLATALEELPDVDFMPIVSAGTPNYINSYPEEYALPEASVEQKRYQEGDYEIVERTFHTPAGDLDMFAWTSITQDGKKLFLNNGDGTFTDASGEVVEEIVKRSTEFDLLIMGASRESWVRRTVWGDKTMRIAQRVQCPLMLVNLRGGRLQYGVASFCQFFWDVREGVE